jgi:23S rRNA (guanosine2251-2'-O)-methyltransferase
MEYNNQNKKNRPQKSGGTKKYPMDKNFDGKRDRNTSVGAKGGYRKPYDAKGPYDGDRRHAQDDRFDRPTFERRDTEVYDESEQDRETEGMVIGRNAVRELLRSDRTIDKLLVRRGDREGSIVVLVAEAIEKGIPVVEVDKSKLDSLAGFVPHQGVIAMVAQKEYSTVEDILAIAAERGEKPFIVIADGITDPYNLGALIRCAEGMGAHGLIIPRRRAVGLTALVAKSSAGAMEHLAIAKVSNIHNTVQALQKAGVWVYAAEAGGNAHYHTNFEGPVALVLGSEGDGVSRVVKDACDGIVSIPMYGKVNSFNVSTAAAVVLAEIARQHHKNDPN